MAALTVITVAGDASHAVAPAQAVWGFVSKRVNKRTLTKSMSKGWLDIHCGSAILHDDECSKALEGMAQLKRLVNMCEEAHEDGHALKAELKTLKFYQITKKNEMYKKIVKWLDKAEGFKLDVMTQSDLSRLGLVDLIERLNKQSAGTATPPIPPPEDSDVGSSDVTRADPGADSEADSGVDSVDVESVVDSIVGADVDSVVDLGDLGVDSDVDSVDARGTTFVFFYQYSDNSAGSE